MKIINEEILLNRGLSEIEEDNLKLKSPIYVSGLSEVNRANFISAIAEKFDKNILVVCPDEEILKSEKTYIDSMSGEQSEILDERNYTFYSSEAVSRQLEQRRIKVLDKIKNNNCRIVLTTIKGLIERTIPYDDLKKAEIIIKSDDEVAIEDIEDMLQRCGYIKTELVEVVGQYSRRGGILDVFTANYDDPVRIEFWGDEIDSISFFDKNTQRRDNQMDECRILPAAESLISLAKGGRNSLIKKMEKMCLKSDIPEAEHNIREYIEKIKENVSITYADKYMGLIYDFSSAVDFIGKDTIIFLDQPRRIEENFKDYTIQLENEFNNLRSKGLIYDKSNNYYLSIDSLNKKLKDYSVFLLETFTLKNNLIKPKTTINIQAKQLPSYSGSMDTAVEDIKIYIKQEYSVIYLVSDMARARTIEYKFTENGIKTYISEEIKEIPSKCTCVVSIGSLPAGMEYPEIKCAILSDLQIFSKTKHKSKKSKKTSGEKLLSYNDLKVGDLIVHESYGIGRFSGIEKITTDGISKDYMKINYAGTDILYIPCTQLDYITKYIGVGIENEKVKLSKMGGTEWHRNRVKAKAAAKEMAKKLIKLYAERQNIKGFAFNSDTDWQKQFEENFDYNETEDQIRCIEEIKNDMEKPIPMDRLLCGDVGYGKTEVAMRAAMKCIMNNQQVALLCPTTVLANQHYQTAINRFEGFPVNINIISRYQTGKELTSTLTNIKSGKTDFVIGTHRLIQKDVEFKKLGLLIVDEEQRFGVTHKEYIKEMSKGIDVLTLSATPIPRTLNMALTGIRDMSIIEEPPENRQPVQTFVMEHDWDIVTESIKKELYRGGQVYYVHNRIEDIEKTKRKLQNFIGDNVNIGIIHGQMDKAQISNIMEEMVNGNIQILVCTTIIETGIDIPNVNTLIIEDADKMGLSQLHQLRGRVGRSTRKATALLTFRKDKVLTEVQEKRLNAIREFAEFGSGFKIAMRDLEIRGAGNVLGAEQSGHMIDVGYDMYIKLLNEAVKEEKGEKTEEKIDCSIDISVSANIPEYYIPSQEQRMDIYRRISLIESEEEADELMDEVIDRYGDPPSSLYNLIQISILRDSARKILIEEIIQKNFELNFILKDFNMNIVSELYNDIKYKNRLRVKANKKPCLSLSLKPKDNVISIISNFLKDYKNVSKKC